MLRNFKYIDILEGVKVAQELVVKRGIDFFPVVEEERLVGILTYRHLIGVHSNRIVADAMSQTITSISSCTPLWQAKEMVDKGGLDVLLVIDNDELLGIVTKTQIYTELGKHVDLLTELYKSDYIYYYAKKLIELKQKASIIFIDINDFGYIDKKYGHIQGDIILKEIALVLKNNVPSDTYLCRFGGDEFVVLASYYREDCIKLAEYLLDAISDFIFSNGIKVRASAGISILNNILSSNLDSAVYELINEASLASTIAKKQKSPFYVAECVIEEQILEIN
ncbi:GGDEF domain-containing protein [Wukongibacter sp. M2B1]|uniref:GGDEF domain-containing protein n=1 Tax=Wukongibacter sp. M2B1 TaxID=3088895 RepID=UPI003D7BB125